MSFQKTTITVAIILLVLALIFIAYSLYNTKYNTAYPPVDAQCPDYWIYDSKNQWCDNVKGLGVSDSVKCPTKINFDAFPMFTGDDALCNKSKWAKSCDLTWDGVTNNRNACKSSDDN